MPERHGRPRASETLISVQNYKRLIKMGEIPRTKANKRMPPFKMGHAMHLRKVFRERPFLALVCASPAEWVVHELKSPERVRAAAALMGLDRYVGKRVMAIRRPAWVRQYFNEAKMTLALCDDRTGTRTIIPFADWDALGVAGAVPDIHYTPEELSYEGGKRKRVHSRDENGDPVRYSSNVAVFDPNTFKTKAMAYDYLGFVTKGFRYKEEVLNNQGAGKTGICYIQENPGLADWGKENIARAEALAARLQKSSDYRKR